MSGVIQIDLSAHGQTAGPPLADVLNAQFRVEAWTKRSTLAARALILISFPMAYLLFVGAANRTAGIRMALSFWSLTVVSLATCALAAARARRRLTRLLAEGGGRVIGASPDAAG
ncbi:MAG TPA: hypothetical protein VFH73_22755 [Polyangia bacterium]|jgi:hypothetical protein|nr:hypothetical protein [Polyangia bacterium]